MVDLVRHGQDVTLDAPFPAADLSHPLRLDQHLVLTPEIPLLLPQQNLLAFARVAVMLRPLLRCMHGEQTIDDLGKVLKNFLLALPELTRMSIDQTYASHPQSIP